MTVHFLEELLSPRSVAVAGVSKSGWGGSQFVNAMKTQGFQGEIYPVNPKYEELFDMKVYPSVKDIPGPVDYVISSVPSHQVLNLIDDCIHKGVRIIHLFTARFSETGRQDAIELEQEVLRRARSAGIRIIGPNCMGVCYPKMGLAFRPAHHAKVEPGRVGFISQSGSVAGEMIEMCNLRGMSISKGVSYGNAIDLNESDYLEYLGEDPETDIILMYVEGVRDGRRFFNTLKKVTSQKPVIIIKGGRGVSGTRATASHTASLAGSIGVWNVAVSQAGAINVANMSELIDMAVAFHFLPPVYDFRVGVGGGAGGTSVTAADQCEEAGLNVVPLPDTIRNELKKRGNPAWDWISNPVDFSILPRDEESVEVLQLMAVDPGFDLVINYVSPHHFHRFASEGQERATIEEFMEKTGISKPDRNPIMIILDDRGQSEQDETGENFRFLLQIKKDLISAGMPIYFDIGSAARAANKMINHYRRQAARKAVTS